MDADDKRRENLTPGGKSLSGGGKHSPVLQVRLGEATREQLKEVAAAAGMSPSRYVRGLIERDLADRA